MFTFKHVTRFATDNKDATGKAIQAAVSEMLTVPQTMAELYALGDDAPMVEIMVGHKEDGKTEYRISVPLPVADYIRGRKLRSNQEMQAANKDGGKKVKRADTAAWLSMQPELIQEFMRSLAGCRTPQGEKAHNAWLDGLYDRNKDAIELNAESH